MKATALLEQQHRKVRTLFKKLASGRSEAQPVLSELANDLVAHMGIEHEIFYPAIAAVDAKLMGEAFEEHALGEIALKRLLQTDPNDERFASRVTAAMELIEHHVKEEQEELFPKVEKKLGDARLEELGKQMKARFVELRAAGYEAALPKGYSRTLADTERKLVKKRARKQAA